jgi:hypothetical protein
VTKKSRDRTLVCAWSRFIWEVLPFQCSLPAKQKFTLLVLVSYSCDIGPRGHRHTILLHFSTCSSRCSKPISNEQREVWEYFVKPNWVPQPTMGWPKFPNRNLPPLSAEASILGLTDLNSGGSTARTASFPTMILHSCSKAESKDFKRPCACLCSPLLYRAYRYTYIYYQNTTCPTVDRHTSKSTSPNNRILLS